MGSYIIIDEFNDMGDEEMKTGREIFDEINGLKKQVDIYDKSFDRFRFSGDEDEFDDVINLLENERRKYNDKLIELMNMKYKVNI